VHPRKVGKTKRRGKELSGLCQETTGPHVDAAGVTLSVASAATIKNAGNGGGPGVLRISGDKPSSMAGTPGGEGALSRAACQQKTERAGSRRDEPGRAFGAKRTSRKKTVQLHQGTYERTQRPR